MAVLLTPSTCARTLFTTDGGQQSIPKTVNVPVLVVLTVASTSCLVYFAHLFRYYTHSPPAQELKPLLP